MCPPARSPSRLVITQNESRRPFCSTFLFFSLAPLLFPFPVTVCLSSSPAPLSHTTTLIATLEMAPALDIRATRQDPPTPPNGLESVTASLKKANLDNIVDYQDFHYASNVTAESTYPHAALLPTFPDDPQPPLDGLTPADDRGAYSKARGGWEKGPLAKRANIEHVVPNIGSEITGIDLRTLSNAEKDDLYALPPLG